MLTIFLGLYISISLVRFIFANTIVKDKLEERPKLNNSILFYILKFHLNNKFRIYKDNNFFKEHIVDLINKDNSRLVTLSKFLDGDLITEIAEKTAISNFDYLSEEVDSADEFEFVRHLLISSSRGLNPKNVLSCFLFEFLLL